MSVYSKNKYNNKKLNINITDKFRGILQLEKLNIATPEWIYIDSEEFEYFRKYKKFSEELISNLKAFVDFIDKNGSLSLFSIRGETKYGNKDSARPPLSLLNVGLFFSKERLSQKELWENCFTVYTERTELLSNKNKYENKIRSSTNVIEEILANIEMFYDEMYLRMKNVNDFNYGIILQKMVFGNNSRYSGNGILCRPLSTNKKVLNGVYMIGQVGMGVRPGSWGENEVDLTCLKQMSPDLYNKLLDIFKKIEYMYGEDCYIEFTIDKNKIYILDYKKRRRDVKVSELGAYKC